MYWKTKHKTNFFLFIFLFLFTILDAQPIAYGDATTASISAVGEIDTYTFEGNAGDVIRIRMRGSSQGVDGCFKLLDPSGNLLSEECDDGGIVQLTSFELTSSGTFSIIASDHNDNDTGDYGLSLEVLNGPDGVTMVNCGDDILTTLENWTEVDLFGLECAAGDQIMIQMRSTMSNVECRLELIDQNGVTIANEVTQTGLASISSFAIPTDGVYVIAAYDGNGNDLGEYGISFQLLNEAACATSIDCGTTINNSFNQVAQIDAYTINCLAGDQLIIRASDLGDALEPNLVLCDANGVDIVSAMDPETAEISYNIQNSGAYNIIVRDDRGNDVGDYSLALQVVNNSSCSEFLDCGNNSFSTTLDEENEVDVYSFKAEEGEIINVQMRGYLNGIDAFIKIYDTAGNLLDSDYSNGSMAAINGLVIPAQGFYSITAEDRNGNDTGEYGLSFQRVNFDLCPTNLSCDNGNANGRIDFFAEMDVYEFTAEAGEIVTFEMTEIDAALEPMIRFYAPDGTLLVEEHKSFHVDVTDYVLPQTGRYVLVCLDKNGNDTGAYTLDFNLNFDNGTSVCSTCNNGVQDGTETGIDCGGPDCIECCPEAGTACDDGDANTFNDVADGNCGCAGEICPTSNAQCTVCPEDLVLYCSDLESNNSSAPSLPTPTNIQGDGGFNMVINFSERIEISGVCDIFSATFDSGCKGIITACFGNTLQLTPDFPTCQGPLPVLPFTITFNDELSIYFDENGQPTESSNNGIADIPDVQDWLTAGLNEVVCNVEAFTNDFDPSIFDSVCDGDNSAEAVSQTVNFSWIDLCGNEIACQALFTVINDNEPPCPEAGIACNDFNPDTENDAQDGNCNCIGTVIPPAPSECDRLDLSTVQPVSYGGNADQGQIQIIEDDHGYLLTNNAWKAIPFEYTITPDTKLEFEFMSSQQGEIHGIGFENNLSTSSSASFLFQLYGTQTYGNQTHNDFTVEGVYKKYIITVGQFYTGQAQYMTFVMDDDAFPRDGNSLFRNIKVYEGTCPDESATITGCGTGSITREVWLDIPGYDLNSIPWNTTPDISEEMTKFEAPIDIDDHYGTRMSGFICPPQTGNYTFWISSDDQGELWLSSDDNPDNVQLIAEVEGWTYPQVWDKYTGQQSVEIYLEEGKRYYIEALQKEHEGLDNLAVGWQWPNGTLERPIIGAHLSPFTGTRSPRSNRNNNRNSDYTTNGYTTPTTEPDNGNSNNPVVAEINIYPNPATDAINVDLTHFVGQDINVYITNNFGQPIYQQSFNGLSQSVLNVDMSGPTVANGLYNVLVLGADGISVTQSFLIVR